MPKQPKIPQSEFSKSLLKLSQDIDQIMEGAKQLRADWRKLLQKPPETPPAEQPPVPPGEGNAST